MAWTMEIFCMQGGEILKDKSYIFHGMDIYCMQGGEILKDKSYTFHGMDINCMQGGEILKDKKLHIPWHGHILYCQA